MKRVLFISYCFPPVGGVGVQRVTKFVKYLQEFGWESSVLTAANPSVPLFDESLLKDIPDSTIVRKARTLEPGYRIKQAVSASGKGSQQVNKPKTWLKSMSRGVANTLLQPDVQILWLPAALKEGLALLNEIQHDAIVATGPPFSSFLLGAKLAQKTGLPLFLDYRDEWSISNAYWENKQQGHIANWVQRRMHFYALRAAQMVIATTPSSTQAVLKLAKAAGSRACGECIYNGFDSSDFPVAAAPHVKPDYGNGIDRYRLSFIGTLWNLNSIEPLIEAICRLATVSPQIVERLELVCVGRRLPDQEAILDRLNSLPCKAVRLPFVTHEAAINLMRLADALLMLNTDLPHTQRIINAKTFEYMAARRPLFVIAPEGDVWDILLPLPGTVLLRPSEIVQIAEQLALEIERHRCGIHFDNSDWNIERFERKAGARQLAGFLDGIITP
jgi:glycosyltransferase involved in cell wall biosynthesis